MAPRVHVSPPEPSLKTEAKAQAAIVGGLLAVMWLLEIVDQIALGGRLDQFGIRPRSLGGLAGIVLAPFLHGGFAHLAANTVPFAVLAVFIMLRRKRDLAVVSLLAALVGGMGVWLVGASNSVHIGASGLVFGFLGYLLSRGVFERRFWTIAGSVVVGLLYGGALFGLLPGRPGISWEGHAFGFVGGVLAAWLLTRPAKQAAAGKRAPARLTAGKRSK